MSWFRSLSLVPLVSLASCASNPDDSTRNGPSSDTAEAAGAWEADFAGLSEAQLDAALSAGLAHCPLFASFAFVYSDMDAAITEASPPACPTTEVSGTMVRFTGGCTATGSYTYGGIFEADNAGGLYADYEDGKETTLNFQEYSMADAYGAWSFHGSWSVPPESAENHTVEDVALSCDLGGGTTFGTFGSMDCVAGEYGRECDLLQGMEGEIEGVGRFGLSGSFVVTETGHDGWLQLEGIQTLVFDLSGTVEGCIPYTLDDAPGEYCTR